MIQEELLKKIKALAEQGIGGEKENAQKLLKSLMQKYGITDQDLNDEKIEIFDIKMPAFYNAQKLACQVIYSIVGNTNEKGLLKGGKRYSIKSTAAEFLEFEAKFKFYSHYFKKELEMFYQAWVQANRIFPVKDDSKESGNRKLTQEDLKILHLSTQLENHEFRKQIGMEAL